MITDYIKDLDFIKDKKHKLQLLAIKLLITKTTNRMKIRYMEEDNI